MQRVLRILVKLVIALSVAALMLLFALFIWPTKYSYDRTKYGERIRINRITGYVDLLDNFGWKMVTPRPVPFSEIDTIHVRVVHLPLFLSHPAQVSIPEALRTQWSIEQHIVNELEVLAEILTPGKSFGKRVGDYYRFNKSFLEQLYSHKALVEKGYIGIIMYSELWDLSEVTLRLYREDEEEIITISSAEPSGVVLKEKGKPVLGDRQYVRIPYFIDRQKLLEAIRQRDEISEEVKHLAGNNADPWELFFAEENLADKRRVPDVDSLLPEVAVVSAKGTKRIRW